MVPKAAYWTVLLAMAAGPVLADADDPPSRVARLNYQSGTVSFRPGSVEEWTAATLNYPLTTGDHLWTEGGAQTEMHIGSTAVRMDSQTALSILNLDDRTVQLSVTQGAVNVHIRDLAPDEAYEIDTPNAAISLLRPGDYRIDCDGDRNLTAVTVWDGEAEFTAGDGGLATPVRAGQSARVNGIDQVTQEIVRAAGRGDFERWCEARDRREDRVESARHVSRGTIGYEDLDEYGAWREYPPYGWVWGPRVAAGWAPYRYGHWAWVD
ncbi:MAG: FecR domain-containing protein, partial [Acidobacteriia bacterium]|nr:FecR domain-containing protein [Terriglobia bacterium]